ncbi:hypothetical protein FBU59_004970, partial [Linderina macrospora]
MSQQQNLASGTLGSAGQMFGSSASARFSGSGSYGNSQFGSLPTSAGRHPNASIARPIATLSSTRRASLLHKARHELPSLFGDRKSASVVAAAKTGTAYSAAISAHLASTAATTSASLMGGIGGSAALPDMAEYVPGTRVTRQQAMAESTRDHILQTAHQLYSTNARDPTLIEMLLCLHRLHPRHLPTLLLLACAYFSSSQPEKSLEYNEVILKIDPNYVEAMSNIGTTLRSMGRSSEAETWWWQAVKLRPGYWDAVENLMGVLCNPAQQQQQTGTPKSPLRKAEAMATTGPRYREALQLCEFVDSSLHIRNDVSKDGTGKVSKYQVQDKQLSRLQSLLYSEGNLRFALGDIAGARHEYEKAMEAILGGYKLDEIIVRIAYIGSQESVNQMFHKQLNNQAPPSHNLNIKNLPLTLLAPQNAIRMLQILFPETNGVLPGLVALAGKAAVQQTAGSHAASAQLQQANQVASNLLLTLAKLHQDHAVVAQPLSIVLPLYYMSLSLVPSPSTCNNLGIILSAIPSPSTPTMVPS